MRTWPVILSCLGLALFAHESKGEPDALRPGEYETAGSWGTLAITRAKEGSLRFAIETIGGNGHSCSLRGSIDGFTGREDDDDAGSPCRIDFKPTARGVAVGTETQEACRMFCGVRAGFAGDYLLPPPACRPRQRLARWERFSREYAARQYEAALATLASLEAQCGEWLDWISVDRLRNDKAVTLYHLGRKAECRKTLEATRGAEYRDENALGEDLPPTDFESYLPVARATWHNLKLCPVFRGARQ